MLVDVRQEAQQDLGEADRTACT